MLRAVVVAPPRSGTRYASLVMHALGVRAGHEAIGIRGPSSLAVPPGLEADTSWLLVPYLEQLERTLAPRVVHLLRDPRLVIGSILGRGLLGSHSAEDLGSEYAAFVRFHAPECFAGRTPLSRAVAFWLTWQRWIAAAVVERGTRANVVRVEDLAAGDCNDLVVLAGALDVELTPAARARVGEIPRDANTRGTRVELTWDQLGGEVAETWDELLRGW